MPSNYNHVIIYSTSVEFCSGLFFDPNRGYRNATMNYQGKPLLNQLYLSGII